MAVVLLLGFSSGIPLGLTGSTLQAWMFGAKVDLAVIGIFAALVGWPYAVKFLWSPLMDRFVPPFLGRRRGWMLVMQLALVLGISAMAFTNPAGSRMTLATLAVLVAFFSASQDIVIDAYRTEILETEELGAGTGLAVTGYRIAMLVSGALALILADHVPWRTVYLIMAGAMSVGVVGSLFAPEPKLGVAPPRTLADAVVKPFVEFLRRHGAVEVLVFIFIFKLDVFVAQAMTTPFLLHIGFSNTDIGTVNKAFGLVSTIVGGLVGGALMVRLGMYRSLWTFGLLQGLSGLSFTALALFGKNYPMMITANVVENFCAGLGTVAYTAFIMSICDKRFTATQYALLTSLMAAARTLVSAPTGWLAKTVGWPQYFVIATLIAIPGLLLLFRFRNWTRPAAETEPARENI
jgi:PAT family beta-lactamase induction signal transducer AmpG